MSGSDARQLVPTLRFPDFQDAGTWTTFELGDISQFVVERVGATNCTPYTIKTGVGLVSQKAKLGRTIAGNSLKNYIVLERNDFAYNKSATKANPEGFIALYAGEDRAAVPNSIFTCFRADQKLVIPAFLDKLFSFNLHGKWLRSRIAVGARAHGSLQVSNDDLMAIPVPLPKGARSIAEQQKIADFLSSLDELITAETVRLDALKIHKKGLMQRLFPREGETIPRLRFTEFRDAGKWDHRRMGNLLVKDPEYGLSAPAVPFSDNLPTYLRITDIDDSGRFLRESKVSVGVLATDDNYLEFGDIVLARTGASVGKSYRYREEDGRLVFAGFLIRVRPASHKVYPLFLASFLAADQYWRWVELTSTRSGQPGINGKEYASLPVPLPPSVGDDGGQSEQRRIADCLSSLDDLVTAQTQKINTLKTHRRGLMQQVFPKAREVSA